MSRAKRKAQFGTYSGSHTLWHLFIDLFFIYLLGWKHQAINYNTETIRNQEFGAAGVNSYEILCQTLAKELAFKELDSLTSPSHPSTQSRLCFALACGSGRNREKTLRVLNVLDISDSESYFFIFKSVRWSFVLASFNFKLCVKHKTRTRTYVIQLNLISVKSSLFPFALFCIAFCHNVDFFLCST